MGRDGAARVVGNASIKVLWLGGASFGGEAGFGAGAGAWLGMRGNE